MFIHGHNEAAEELVDDVERQVEEQTASGWKRWRARSRSASAAASASG
jgi:hypothetical protein